MEPFILAQFYILVNVFLLNRSISKDAILQSY